MLCYGRRKRQGRADSDDPNLPALCSSCRNPSLWCNPYSLTRTISNVCVALDMMLQIISDTKPLLLLPTAVVPEHAMHLLQSCYAAHASHLASVFKPSHPTSTPSPCIMLPLMLDTKPPFNTLPRPRFWTPSLRLTLPLHLSRTPPLHPHT